MRRRKPVGGVQALIAAGALACACGRSSISGARLERSIAPTFANLVHAQLARARLAAVAASDIRVSAACYRAAGGARGAGEWVCRLEWSGPNHVVLRDTYDVTVATDGCYTAAVEAGESQLGGSTLPGPDGRPTRNLLFVFDGCFDTT